MVPLPLAERSALPVGVARLLDVTRRRAAQPLIEIRKIVAGWLTAGLVACKKLSVTSTAMSAPENQEGEQRGGRLLTVVFWAGVGLAPLAALILMVGRGAGPMKIAAVLAVLAVVLIGISITLRKDVETVRQEIEDTILDEVDALREDVRNDIATAARATHRQFSEKLQYLHESVEAMRAQLEAMRLGYERPDARPASPPGPPAGGAHHAAGGVVRHTETVQVTTRHTIVDPHGEGQGGRGTVYGRTAEAPPRRPEVWREPRDADPREGGRHDAGQHSESWTEERLRERYAAARAEEARSTPPPRWSEPRDSEPPRGAELRRSRSYDDDPGDDERWSGMRAGDRWASMRTDDRGRELRMGERRAAMHSDETGTELRFEDRWTSLRRDEPRGARYEEPTSRWSEDRWDSAEGTEYTWDSRSGRADRTERRGSPRALPATSSEPSWSDERGWHDEESTSRVGRRRYDREAEPEEAPAPRARARRVDYELSDERWR
jgi:hypothetical protein